MNKALYFSTIVFFIILTMVTLAQQDISTNDSMTLDDGSPIVSIVKIRNTSVSNLFIRLIRLYSSDTSDASTKKMLTLQDTKIVKDSLLNSLILMGTKSNIKQLKKKIQKIDIKIPDVLINVKVLEIVLQDNYKFGIDWSALGDVSVNSYFPSPITGSDSYGGVRVSKIVTGKGFGKFSLNMVLKALSIQDNVKIVSSPSIVVANKNNAQIHIGSTIPYKTTSVTVQGTGTTHLATSYAFTNVGILLDVKPEIYGDYVKLQLSPDISSSLNIAEHGNAPAIDRTRAKTIVTVKNKETVIIGGLIHTQHTKTKNRIPILGYIPLLGYLFSSEESIEYKKEIVMFITVHVIGKNSSRIKKKNWPRMNK